MPRSLELVVARGDAVGAAAGAATGAAEGGGDDAVVEGEAIGAASDCRGLGGQVRMPGVGRTGAAVAAGNLRHAKPRLSACHQALKELETPYGEFDAAHESDTKQPFWQYPIMRRE